MKKFFLLLLLAFVFLLIFVDRVIATTLHPPDDRTKKISCEELHDIALSKVNTCKLADLTFEGYVWCAENEAEFDSYGRDEFGGSRYYKVLVPSYTYDFSREECFESWAKEKGITPSVSESEATQQPEAPKQEKQPGKQSKTSLIDTFGINPFEAWLRLKGMMEVTEFIVSGDLGEAMEQSISHPFGKKTVTEKDAEQIKAKEDSYKRIFGENWQEAIYREPTISTKDEQKAWAVSRDKILPDRDSLTFVEGQGQVKGPDINQFIPITNLSTEYLPVVYQGVDLEPMIVRYSWDTNSGAVMNSNGWEKIEFKKPVTDGGELTTRAVQFRDGNGEVEIKVKNENPAQDKLKVETDFFDLFVIQTHFWINQSQDKKIAVIGVYEGEVEIQSRDGKTIKIIPEGEKPGVVVITRRLSVQKLILLGLIVAAVIGGGMFLLNRKFVAKVSSKKRR